VSKSAILNFYHADIIRFNLADHEVGLTVSPSVVAYLPES